MDIDREKALEFTDALLAGELPPEKKELLKRYLSKNPEFKEEMKEIKRAWNELEALDEKVGEITSNRPEEMSETLRNELQQFAEHAETEAGRTDQSERSGDNQQEEVSQNKRRSASFQRHRDQKEETGARPFTPRKTSRVRSIAAAAVFLIAVASGIFLVNRYINRDSSEGEDRQAIATIRQTTQTVKLFRNGTSMPIKEGEPIKQNDRIEVSGSGECIVRYVDQQTDITLTDGAKATFGEKNGTREIQLETGVLKGDVEQQPPGENLVLITRDGRAKVIGTKFTLSSNGISRLEVTEGSVQFESTRTGESVVVSRGEYAQTGKDSPLTTGVLPEFKPANKPPIADAGSDVSVMDRDGNGKETVRLDATGSKDPDGMIEEFVWSKNGNELGRGKRPRITLPTGTHRISLSVTDDRGGSDTDQVLVTVREQIKKDRQKTNREHISRRSENSVAKKITFPKFNPKQSEQFVIDSTDDWNAINDPEKRIFWVEPGDYTDRGQINITADGTKNNRRWILYRNPDRPNRKKHIWDMSPTKRATVAYLEFRDADFWVVDRLRLNSGIRVTGDKNNEGSSDHNIFHRLMWKEANNDYIRSGIRFGRRFSKDPGHDDPLATKNTLQNCIIAGIQPVDSKTDVVGVVIAQSEDTHIVNCEIFDVTDGLQTSIVDQTAKGTVIQNCDFYYTERFANHPDSRIEDAIDIKAHWPDEQAPADKSEWLLIEGNRIRDYNVIAHYQYSNFIRITGNILFDIDDEFAFVVHKKKEINYRFEVTNNVVFHTQKGFKPRHLDNSLFENNVFVDVRGDVTWSWFSNPENNTVRRNVFINSDVGTKCLKNTVERNAYYNSTPFACDSTDGEKGTIIRKKPEEAKHTDLKFQFRQISGPVDRTVPNSKVTPESPHSSWFQN